MKKIVIILFIILACFFSGCEDDFDYGINVLGKNSNGAYEEDKVFNKSDLPEEREVVKDDTTNEMNEGAAQEELQECDTKCLIQKAISSKNVSFCKEVYDYESCVRGLVREGANVLSVSDVANICNNAEEFEKECFMIAATEKKYYKLCDELDDVYEKFDCYSQFEIASCYDSDGSDELNNELGFACSDDECVMDYCVSNRVCEQACDNDGNIIGYTYDCEKGCFGGLCNKGVFGREMNYLMSNPGIFTNEFSFRIVIGDGAVSLDLKNVVLEVVAGESVEVKKFSDSGYGFGSFRVDSRYGEAEKNPVLDFENTNAYFRTKLNNIPLRGKFGLLLKEGRDEIFFVIGVSENNSRYVYEVIETIKDSSEIDEMYEELKSGEVLVNDYSDEAKRIKNMEKKCREALDTRFGKLIEDKCLDVDISCGMLQNRCIEGKRSVEVSCKGEYVDLGERVVFDESC